MRVAEHDIVYFLSIEFFLFQLIGIRKPDSENEIQIIRIWLTINVLIRPLPITHQGTIHTQLLTINPRSSINQTIDIRFDTFALTSPLGVLSIKSTVVVRSIKKTLTLVKIRLIKGGFQSGQCRICNTNINIGLHFPAPNQNDWKVSQALVAC